MTTPEYTKRAVDNYRSKFDLLQLRLPKGWKDKITDLTGKKPHDYIIELITADIERLENISEAEKAEQARKEHEKRMYESTKEAPEEYPVKRYPDDYTEEELSRFNARQKEILEQLQIMRDRL